MDPGASSNPHVGSVQNASDEPRPDHLGRAETGLDPIVGCSAPCGHEEKPIDDLSRRLRIDGFVQRRQVDHDVPVLQPCGGQDSLDLRRCQDGRRVRERRLGTGRKEGESGHLIRPEQVIQRGVRFEELSKAGLRLWSDPLREVGPPEIPVDQQRVAAVACQKLREVDGHEGRPLPRCGGNEAENHGPRGAHVGSHLYPPERFGELGEWRMHGVPFEREVGQMPVRPLGDDRRSCGAALCDSWRRRARPSC